MIQIASNKYYSLSVDQEKNRIYLKIIGTWSDFEEPHQYITDIQKAKQLLEPGFTILTDAKEMGTFSYKIELIHLEAIQILKDGGVAEIAEVFPHNKMVHLQNEEMMRGKQMHYNFFDNADEAEKWLDESVKEH